MSGSEQEYGTMSSLLNKRKLVMFASSENPTWYIPVDVAAVVADINAGRLTTLNTVQRDALKAAGYEDLVNNMDVVPTTTPWSGNDSTPVRDPDFSGNQESN